MSYNDLYSNEDETFIVENYLSMTDAEIGNKLNRGKFSVRVKRNRMGLSKYQLIPKTPVDQNPNESLYLEIDALVIFCETTKSSHLKDIAKARLEYLMR